ncbi:hypothetical protein V8F06_012856 [Rhypophila decipiens]
MHLLRIVASAAALALVSAPLVIAAPLDTTGGIPIGVPTKSTPDPAQVDDASVATKVIGSIKDDMHALQPIGSSWSDEYGPLRSRPFPVWKVNSDDDFKGYGSDTLVRQWGKLENILKYYGAWDDESKGPVGDWRPKKLNSWVEEVLDWFKGFGLGLGEKAHVQRRDLQYEEELDDLLAELLAFDEVDAADEKDISLLGLARRDRVVPEEGNDSDSDNDDYLRCPNELRDATLPKCACVTFTKPKKWDLLGVFHEPQRIIDWSRCERYFKEQNDNEKIYSDRAEVYDLNGDAVLPAWVAKDDLRLPKCANVHIGRRSGPWQPRPPRRKYVANFTNCYGLLSKAGGPENKVIHYGKRPEYVPACARLNHIWVTGMGPEVDYSVCRGTGVSNFADQIRVSDDGDGIFIPFGSSLDYLPKCARVSFSGFESRPGYFVDYTACVGPLDEWYRIGRRDVGAGDLALLGGDKGDEDLTVYWPGVGPVPRDKLTDERVLWWVRGWLVRLRKLPANDRWPPYADADMDERETKELQLVQSYLSLEDLAVLPTRSVKSFVDDYVLDYSPEHIDAIPDHAFQDEAFQDEDMPEGVTDRASLHKWVQESRDMEVEELKTTARRNRKALANMAVVLRRINYWDPRMAAYNNDADDETATGAQLTRRQDKYTTPGYVPPGKIKVLWDQFWKFGEYKFCFYRNCKTYGSDPGEMTPESQYLGHFKHAGNFDFTIGVSKTIWQWLNGHLKSEEKKVKEKKVKEKKVKEKKVKEKKVKEKKD